MFIESEVRPSKSSKRGERCIEDGLEAVLGDSLPLGEVEQTEAEK